MSTRGSRALAILVALGFVVTACGGGATLSPTATEAPAAVATAAPAVTQAPASTEAPTAAAAAKCVRIANYENSGEKMSMDPSILYSGGDAPYIYAAYNRLVNVTSNFEVIPDLADSFESTQDATEWTFHLHKGVKFHDGTELTAKDVVYTYARLLDKTTGSSGYAVLSPVIKPENIIAKDDYTVVFKPNEASVLFPLLLTTKETGVVRDGAKSADLRLHENGTGPFVQDHFVPGENYVKLVANPNYWKPGLPKAPCLEIRSIAEATTAAAAIQSGDIDIVQQVDSSVIPTLKADSHVQLLQTAAGNSMTFSMFTDKPPFNNIQVRQALKKVIDRDQMVQLAVGGYGEVGADNPIPLSDPLSYLYGQAAPKQDIEGAKALLAKAGYNEKNPLKLDLYTAEAIPGFTRMAQVFQDQAGKAGIVVNIIVTPAASFWDAVWLKQAFVTSAWSRRPVIVAEGTAYSCTSQYPETHWCRPAFDALMAKASTTTEVAARTTILHQMQQMIADDGGVIIPMFVHAVAAMRAECSGWAPHVQNFNNDWSQVSCTR